MSDLLQDIQVDLFLPDFKAVNQKQVLQHLAKHAANSTACAGDDLFNRLVEKEKISTFAIGEGLALPNLQIKYLYRPFKALCALKKPVSFNAPDAQPVDFVCLILSPEQDGPLHLRRLARMSRVLKSPVLRNELREAADLRAAQSLLSHSHALLAA